MIKYATKKYKLVIPVCVKDVECSWSDWQSDLLPSIVWSVCDGRSPILRTVDSR